MSTSATFRIFAGSLTAKAAPLSPRLVSVAPGPVPFAVSRVPFADMGTSWCLYPGTVSEHIQFER